MLQFSLSCVIYIQYDAHGNEIPSFQGIDEKYKGGFPAMSTWQKTPVNKQNTLYKSKSRLADGFLNVTCWNKTPAIDIREIKGCRIWPVLFIEGAWNMHL